MSAGDLSPSIRQQLHVDELRANLNIERMSLRKAKLDRYLKKKRPLNEFTEKVVRVIISIPKGKVVTYGQVAELAGKPGYSRMVAFILRTVVNENVPWQRIIGASGRISIPKHSKGFRLQRKLLEKEGVVFTGSRVDLDRYRWKKGARNSAGRPQPRMFSW